MSSVWSILSNMNKSLFKDIKIIEDSISNIIKKDKLSTLHIIWNTIPHEEDNVAFELSECMYV